MTWTVIITRSPITAVMHEPRPYGAGLLYANCRALRPCYGIQCPHLRFRRGGYDRKLPACALTDELIELLSLLELGLSDGGGNRDGQGCIWAQSTDKDDLHACDDGTSSRIDRSTRQKATRDNELR